MGENLVTTKLVCLSAAVVLVCGGQPARAVQATGDPQVRISSLTDGFNEGTLTFLELRNDSAFEMFALAQPLRTDASPELLERYLNQPAPAILPRPIIIPSGGSVVATLSTDLLPRGLDYVDATWKLGRTATSLDREIQVHLPKSSVKLPPLPIASVKPCPASQVETASRFGSDFTAVDAIDRQAWFIAQTGAESFAIVRGPCPQTTVSKPTGVTYAPFDAPRIQDAELRRGAVTLVIPYDRLNLGFVWAKNNGPAASTVRFTIGKQRVAAKVLAKTTKLVLVDSTHQPNTVSLGTIQRTVPLGFERAPLQRVAVQVPCVTGPNRYFEEMRNENRWHWFPTENPNRATTYRVSGGKPLQVIGYAYGPCTK